jgi:hypothetical protein
VHHERLMALAVFADVLELEALGQGEVELHGGVRYRHTEQQIPRFAR